MKRYGILVLALALSCTLFTGCRRGGNMGNVSPTNQAATQSPTMATVIPETQPATRPAATAPTERDTQAATEHMPAETENGATETGPAGRHRSPMR